MSSQREELQKLVESLPEDRLTAVLLDVHRHLAVPADRPWPPAWFGVATGARSDSAARVDELLEEGFGRTT
jgi:hypothetical protein